MKEQDKTHHEVDSPDSFDRSFPKMPHTNFVKPPMNNFYSEDFPIAPSEQAIVNIPELQKSQGKPSESQIMNHQDHPSEQPIEIQVPEQQSRHSSDDVPPYPKPDEEIRDCNSIIEIHEIMSKRNKRIMAVIFILIYAGLWILYNIFKKELWNASVKTSAKLSHYGGFLLYYSWFFSEIMYKWYFMVIAILLLYAPRKDSALKSISLFLISYFVRQHLRLFIEEGRPNYDSLDIRLRNGCNCSYGMPSGHSEGSAMLYSLLIYELVIQTKHYTRRAKICVILVGIYIVLSVMFSRVYYGRHSIPQVILGAWQSIFFFSLMILFESSLDRFFRRFLNRGKPEATVLMTIAIIMTATNLVMWYIYFDATIINRNLPIVACHHCFADRALKIRDDLGKGLTYPTIGLGMVIGYVYGRTSFLEYNEHMLKLHWSLRGLWRTLVMLAMHWPLLIALIVKMDPDVAVSVTTVLYLIAGFQISYVNLLLNARLHIFIRGDIRLHHHVKQSEVGLPLPQPVPEPLLREDARQDFPKKQEA